MLQNPRGQVAVLRIGCLGGGKCADPSVVLFGRMTIRHTLRRHILVIGSIIFIAGLIAASDTLHDKTGEIIVWCEALISRFPSLGMLVFVLLSIVAAMVAFFSSAVFVPIAVYAWGTTVCLILLWLGWLLGGIASFCVGRFLGRSVAAMLVGEERLTGWQQQVQGRTKFIHILLFQAAVPSEIPGYVLGILRYKFPLYLVALAITEMPYAVAAVYLGESFLEGQSMLFILLGAGAIALSAVGFKAFRRLTEQR